MTFFSREDGGFAEVVSYAFVQGIFKVFSLGSSGSFFK